MIGMRAPDWVPLGMVSRTLARSASCRRARPRGRSGHVGAQRRSGHRQLHHHLEVVAVALEGLVGLDGRLDVQVAGRATAGAHLALGFEVDPVARVHAGGDLDVDGALRTDAALAGALNARMRNDRAVAAAVRAGLGGANVTQERALHRGDVPRPWQVVQVTGSEPLRAPVPPQGPQITAVSTRSGLVMPNAASARVSCSLTRASWPRRTRERGPREPAPPNMRVHRGS